jgi:two-component system cell cycle sensor histidine kinase/response regulator CckA
MGSSEQTAEADRIREEPFRLLIEGVKDYAIFMLDPSGNVRTWNSGAERIFGYKADEGIGQHYSLFFRVEDAASGQPQQELVKAAAEGHLDISGWRARKDGSRFWANGLLTALYDENREVRGFAKITSDLTEKHRQDVLLRSILDHVQDSIFCIDHQGIIATCNEAAEKVFGYSHSEVIGKNLNLLVSDSTRSDHDAHFATLLRTGVAVKTSVGRVIESRRKDGSHFPALLTLSEFQTEVDESRHFTCVVHDLTEQRKLETQLHQSQKMEAFGQLAGGVAHDFNNLLTVIIGYTEILVSQMLTDDPQRAMLETVQRAGHGAASLTRQLLAFSRQQILAPQVVDINAVVNETQNMLRRLIGEDLKVVAVLAPTLDPVKVDPDQFKQVIINLAVNARDAMPHGGTFTIQTRNVELDETHTKASPEFRPGRYVLLAISDTGCGMLPAVIAHIFEPFFTTKGVGKGTGLGLAVVQGIVKQSGGHIEVQSLVGAGSTFNIYLPPAQWGDARAPLPEVSEPIPGTETILLVEDDQAVRVFSARVLQNYGYTVLQAASGRDAMQVAEGREGKLDLLVTDVVMPEMNGGKLAEALCASHPRLKVLYLSGYTADAVIRAGIQQGEVAFLQKPYAPRALATKVREVLDSK